MYAFAFFKGYSLDFHFLHVGFQGSIESKSNVCTQGVSVSGLIPKGIQARLDDLMVEINQVYPDHQHRLFTHIEHSFFIDGIRKAVRNLDIDFIVMGTKGASGLKGISVGSHAGAVITRVKCTTLVIPEDAYFNTPLNIAFPTDFNILYKQGMMESLNEFASYYTSSVKVLRVAREGGELDEEQKRNREFLSDSLREIPHSFHWIQNPELEKGLQTFIDSMGIDVIAMVGKNLNFFQRLLFKPTIEKISYHTKIPFLVLHE